MTQTYLFPIKGLHCKSCVFLTESALKEVKMVSTAATSLRDNTVKVTGEFGDLTQAEVMDILNATLKPHHYTLSLEQEKGPIAWSDFILAVPIASLFIAGFILLQKLGIVNLVNVSNISYGTAFTVGLIASVSTCMAVVGGIILSLSANFAKEGDHIRPSLLFHAGRLISFFLLGGVIGALGSVFQLGATGMLVLGLIVTCVLLVLGINLLDLFPWAKRIPLALPMHFAASIHRLKNLNHVLTPLLIGIVTFFLPCGFTQSMQIYTLTTGSFWKGGFTMLAFALGTLPVLAALSFSSVGAQKKAWSGVFFKAIGLIVLFFGVFTLINTLVAAGIINPLFSL